MVMVQILDQSAEVVLEMVEVVLLATYYCDKLGELFFTKLVPGYISETNPMDLNGENRGGGLRKKIKYDSLIKN